MTRLSATHRTLGGGGSGGMVRLRVPQISQCFSFEVRACGPELNDVLDSVRRTQRKKGTVHHGSQLPRFTGKGVSRQNLKFLRFCCPQSICQYWTSSMRAKIAEIEKQIEFIPQCLQVFHTKASS